MKLKNLVQLFLLLLVIGSSKAINQPVWSYKTAGDIWSVSVDGYVVAGSSDHKIYLFNKIGELLWSYDTGDQV